MTEIKANKQVTITTKINLYGKSIELGKLLGLDETINLLLLLKEAPRQYKDIASSIKLSQPSLSRRLLMLQNYHIIKKEPYRSKSRDTHTYNLTIQGEKLMKFFYNYEKEVNLPLEQQKIIEIEKNK